MPSVSDIRSLTCSLNWQHWQIWSTKMSQELSQMSINSQGRSVKGNPALRMALNGQTWDGVQINVVLTWWKWVISTLVDSLPQQSAIHTLTMINADQMSWKAPCLCVLRNREKESNVSQPAPTCWRRTIWEVRMHFISQHNISSVDLGTLVMCYHDLTVNLRSGHGSASAGASSDWSACRNRCAFFAHGQETPT